MGWVLVVMGRMERVASARCRDKGARGSFSQAYGGVTNCRMAAPRGCAHDDPNSQVALCVGSRRLALWAGCWLSWVRVGRVTSARCRDKGARVSFSQATQGCHLLPQGPACWRCAHDESNSQVGWVLVVMGRVSLEVRADTARRARMSLSTNHGTDPGRG